MLIALVVLLVLSAIKLAFSAGVLSGSMKEMRRNKDKDEESESMFI